MISMTEFRSNENVNVEHVVIDQLDVMCRWCYIIMYGGVELLWLQPVFHGIYDVISLMHSMNDLVRQLCISHNYVLMIWYFRAFSNLIAMLKNRHSEISLSV